MAEFTAPLFLGDDFLLECLNGTASMGDRAQDQAPPESVQRVQTALQRLGYDIGAAGADGVWGAATYQAVLAFKTALDIRTPDGTLDGYVGPRTMAALEAIFGVDAFDATASSLIDLGARVAGQNDYGDGIYTVQYERGVVVASPETMRWPIPTPLSNLWEEAGGPWGYGLPADNPDVLLDSVWVQSFQTSALIETSDGEAAEIPLAALSELNTGAVGVPTAAAAPLVDGGEVIGLPGTEGTLLWASDGPAVSVPTSIADQWVAEEQSASPLGVPMSAGIVDPNGVLFAFTHGGLLLADDGVVTRTDPSLIQLDRFRMQHDPNARFRSAVDGNDVKLLVGGPAFFASVANDLARVGANGAVYISSWNCEIDLAALSAGATLRQELTRLGTLGAEIRMQLWAAQVPATDAAAFIPYIGPIIWGLHRAYLAPSVNNQVAVAAVNAIPNAAAILDANHAFAGSHHQKIIVIHTGDDLVAYVGGIEFTNDRILRINNGSPLFDVSVRISGPGAQLVRTTFAERWSSHPDGAAHPLNRATTPFNAAPQGSCRVQVGHTYAQGYPYARSVKSARSLTVHALLSCRRYFYMEDQYYVGDPQLGAAIKAVLHDQPQVIGIVVIAAEDSVSDLPDVGFRRRKFINDITAQFPGRFLVFEAVGDDGTSTGEHAYVHSKLTIVDDEAFVIGSMNSSRRSYNHDSEVMASIVDLNGPAGVAGTPGLAATLRTMLWQQHLRIIGQPPVPIAPLAPALAAWTAASLGPPGIAVRPYPPAGVAPNRPWAPDSALDFYWDTFADPTTLT
ncbi:hypothetical protein A5633_26700 [Mycolicibacterium elephantis]|uniref:phospholipase D-like domain-containing protein n=1 Tax=Mycolicibacterium elephantis TaxID=81858 RepID=UPI0007EA44AE|nr:peptidoglycan-binding protein [Mycolicibacterium elephantis]OBA67178.1 hypothetical protein A5633_26700 [Mycolicibacterium elephantis]